MNRYKHIALGLIVTVSITLAAGLAFAQITGWGSTSQPVTTKDILPKERGGEAYSERWTFYSDFDEGGYIDANFSITNLGFGDRKGTVEIEVKIPGKPVYEYKNKVSSGQWSAGKQDFHLHIGDSGVEATANGYRLFHKNGKNAKNGFDVRFINEVPMWQPGDGSLTRGDDFYRSALIAIQADVAGSVRLGGESRTVQGSQSGLGDYGASTFAPYKLAEHFARFHGQSNGVFVAWREIQTTPEMGGRSFSWIVVAYKDEIVFSEVQPTINFARRIRHSKSGYSVPRAAQVVAQQGNDRVKLVMRGKKFEHTDLLDEYGSVARLFASTVTNPHKFAVPVEWEMQMTIDEATAKVSGESEFSIDFMNK